MALVLCIDTAMETASVGLCSADEIIGSLISADQKNHAAFVQPAIQKMMQSGSFSFNDLDAVAVVNGPGSYTGLRVGLASAKGISYATGKPLILLNTLEVMAMAAIEQYGDETALYCPMIDARRNEVFTVVYDFYLHPILAPQPLIIEENSFNNIIEKQKIYFFGSGHNKCKKTLLYENAVFSDTVYSLHHISQLAQQYYRKQRFLDIAYAEPFYTKDFYLPVR